MNDYWWCIEWCQISRGDRPDARNVVILVSDGDANIAAAETIPEAVRLKNERQAVVKALAIGQTSFINFNVLRSVVSRPSQRNIFNTTSFNSLRNLTGQLINATCNGLSHHLSQLTMSSWWMLKHVHLLTNMRVWLIAVNIEHMLLALMSCVTSAKDVM